MISQNCEGNSDRGGGSIHTGWIVATYTENSDNPPAIGKKWMDQRVHANCWGGQNIHHQVLQQPTGYILQSYLKNQGRVDEVQKLSRDLRRALYGYQEPHKHWKQQKWVQNPLPGIFSTSNSYIPPSRQPLYSTIHLPMCVIDCASDWYLTHNWWPITDIPFTIRDDNTAALSHVIEFNVFSTIPTTRTSLNPLTVVATNTIATTIQAITTTVDATTASLTTTAPTTASPTTAAATTPGLTTSAPITSAPTSLAPTTPASTTPILTSTATTTPASTMPRPTATAPTATAHANAAPTTTASNTTAATTSATTTAGTLSTAATNSAAAISTGETTIATNTTATSTAFHTSNIIMYASSSDVSTVASSPSPVSLYWRPYHYPAKISSPIDISNDSKKPSWLLLGSSPVRAKLMSWLYWMVPWVTLLLLAMSRTHGCQISSWETNIWRRWNTNGTSTYIRLLITPVE